MTSRTESGTPRETPSPSSPIGGDAAATGSSPLAPREIPVSRIAGTETIPDDPIVDPKAFRQVLGTFASGVVVVTTVYAGEPRGMTANAFVSVSLEPPLVLVSLDNRSRMHRMLPETGAYGVSVLARDQVALSQHFAGRPQEGLAVRFVWHDNLPLLEGAVAHLTCRVVDTHPAGDHTLYIGRVRYLGAVDYRPPLLFHGGRYKYLEVQHLDYDFWW